MSAGSAPSGLGRVSPGADGRLSATGASTRKAMPSLASISVMSSSTSSSTAARRARSCRSSSRVICRAALSRSRRATTPLCWMTSRWSRASPSVERMAGSASSVCFIPSTANRSSPAARASAMIESCDISVAVIWCQRSGNASTLPASQQTISIAANASR